MQFSDSIPAHRRSQGRSLFDEAGRYRVESGSRAPGRQSVNISQETMDRMAKKKLTNVIASKIAYNRLGAIGEFETVGQHLATKA